MTPAEQILWQELRAIKLGVHFRRQQVIEGFVVDFYCHKAGLVIELDGGVITMVNRNKVTSNAIKFQVSWDCKSSGLGMKRL